MTLKDMLLPEYDHEMAVTRRVLERAPEADFGWKPHEKSWPMGALAAHLANIPTWTRPLLEDTELDVDAIPEEARPTPPVSRVELLERFDRNVADARRILEGKGDGELLAMWTLKKSGVTVYSMPRVAALRGFVMNHSVHHRGQFSLYLRLRNVPLPAMYGPTADEG